MQSTHGKRYMSMKEFASAARRREGVRATLKAAMEAWATRPGILVLLLFASSVYVAFGGMLEVVSVPKAEVSIAAVAAKPVDVGGGLRSEKILSGSAKASDYFPAGYVNRGRDGDGNVMTYEHD